MAWTRNRPIGLTYREEGACDGYTLFASVRGHHATLVDMDGLVVHRWTIEQEGIQHCKLLANGNLLVQSLPPREGGGREQIGGSCAGLIELDWDGNRVWEYEDVTMHHDFQRLGNGNTVFFRWERIPQDVNDRIVGGHESDSDPETMWGDVVTEISADGEVIREWNSWEHLSFEEDQLCPLESRKEWTHTNSLEVLDDGDWLISCRITSNVIRVDGETGQIKWRWGAPELSHQHNAQMLANGNLLIFDNGCHRRGMPSFSRVVELNPETREIEWAYMDPTVLAFYSFMVSGAERLPNGNTLITEGASGRLFEVTSEKDVVWEFVSPFTLPSAFGPTPAVFRSNRLLPGDPRLSGRQLDPARYADLNGAIAAQEVQREPEFEHYIPQRPTAPDEDGSAQKAEEE